MTWQAHIGWLSSVAMRGPSTSLVSLELAADASTFDAGLHVCDGSGVVRRSGLTRVGGSRRAVNSEVRRHSCWVLTRRVRQLIVRRLRGARAPGRVSHTMGLPSLFPTPSPTSTLGYAKKAAYIPRWRGEARLPRVWWLMMWRARVTWRPRVA